VKELPVACSLTPNALAARRAGLLEELVRRARSHDELATGHRLTFDPSEETLSLIMTVIAAERQCCRFLRFQVIVEPDEGPVSVELTGPAGTREFLSALFES